ncbi:unnamed protein product [Arctogadus glacialis]
MVFMSALSTQIPVPQAVKDAFVELHRLVSFRNPTQRIVRMEMGNAGRPRFIIDRDHVIELLEMGQNHEEQKEAALLLGKVSTISELKGSGGMSSQQ